jgi:hypothetical protein
MVYTQLLVYFPLHNLCIDVYCIYTVCMSVFINNCQLQVSNVSADNITEEKLFKEYFGTFCRAIHKSQILYIRLTQILGIKKKKNLRKRFKKVLSHFQRTICRMLSLKIMLHSELGIVVKIYQMNLRKLL